jgi:hypothetical protein
VQTGKHRVEIGIALSQGHGPTVADAVLDVDAADAIPVGGEFLGGLVSQGGAVSGIVVDPHQRVRQAGQQPDEIVGSERRFQMQLDPGCLRGGQRPVERVDGGFAIGHVTDGRLIDKRQHDAGDAQTLRLAQEPSQTSQALGALGVAAPDECKVHEIVGADRVDGHPVFVGERSDSRHALAGLQGVRAQSVGVIDPLDGAQPGGRG